MIESSLSGERLNPEDIAAAVAYLASDGAGYMTGQTLVLDGGAGSSMFAKKPPEAQKI